MPSPLPACLAARERGTTLPSAAAAAAAARSWQPRRVRLETAAAAGRSGSRPLAPAAAGRVYLGFGPRGRTLVSYEWGAPPGGQEEGGDGGDDGHSHHGGGGGEEAVTAAAGDQGPRVWTAATAADAPPAGVVATLTIRDWAVGPPPAGALTAGAAGIVAGTAVDAASAGVAVATAPAAGVRAAILTTAHEVVVTVWAWAPPRAGGTTTAAGAGAAAAAAHGARGGEGGRARPAGASPTGGPPPPPAAVVAVRFPHYPNGPAHGCVPVAATVVPPQKPLTAASVVIAVATGVGVRFVVATRWGDGDGAAAAGMPPVAAARPAPPPPCRRGRPPSRHPGGPPAP